MKYVLQQIKRGIQKMADNTLMTVEHIIRDPKLMKRVSFIGAGAFIGGILSLYVETPEERRYNKVDIAKDFA